MHASYNLGDSDSDDETDTDSEPDYNLFKINKVKK